MAPPLYPLSTWLRLPSFSSHIYRSWSLFFFFFFLVMITFLPHPTSSSPAKISYADYCELAVPSSTPTSIFFDDSVNSINVNVGFFWGGDKLFAPDLYPSYPAYPIPKTYQYGSFYFHTRNYYMTRTSGIIKLDASIDFMGQIAGPNGRKMVHFELSGFWSKNTGNLSMIGVQSYPKGTTPISSVVFELYLHKNTDISTSLVSGSFESLDRSDSPNFFDLISVLAYAPDNYSYTKIPQAIDSCTHDNVPKESLGVARCAACNDLMSMLRLGRFELDYRQGCDDGYCGPLGFPTIFMNLNQMQCTENGKVHMHIRFFNESNYGYNLNPDTSLLSEGFWDSGKNRLCLVACRIMRDLSVGDCTVGLSLWFPTAFSLTSMSTVVGRIWSTKDESASDYFSTISFRGSESNTVFLPGSRYEYTKTDNATSQCESNNDLYVGDKRYPDGNFIDRRESFDLSVRNIKGDLMTGYATPLLIGETFYGTSYQTLSAALVLDAKSEEMKSSLRNISYKITYSFFDTVLKITTFTLISAEGVYDARTGALCLVGCRDPYSSDPSQKMKSNYLMDCEILISIQLPPLNSKDGGSLYGKIQSTRETSDPLYFDSLELTTRNAYDQRDMYNRGATQSIWRMDTGMITILVSLVLSCIFARMQLIHVKKHPEVLPSISMMMLLDMTLSHLVALILNIESSFLFYGSQIMEDVTLQSGKRVEANEVTVRVATLSAFILQLRLFQWVVDATSLDKEGKARWAAHWTAVRFCLLMYISELFISSFGNTSSYLARSDMPFYVILYAGLVRDGFLMPQILLNIVRNSTDKALSPLFYIGMTVSRAIPRVYGAYIGGYFAPYIDPSISFASAFENLDFRSIVPFQEMILVLFVFLQQQFGGRFFLPRATAGLRSEGDGLVRISRRSGVLSGRCGAWGCNDEEAA